MSSKSDSEIDFFREPWYDGTPLETGFEACKGAWHAQEVRTGRIQVPAVRSAATTAAGAACSAAVGF